LFPKTRFYEIQFVGRHQIAEYDYYRHGEVVAWQDSQRYTAETFDRLLAANGTTTITDENRELVAKALVLMTLPDYLGEEIMFSELEEIDLRGGFSFEHYNCALTAWTKIQGLSIWYAVSSQYSGVESVLTDF